MITITNSKLFSILINQHLFETKLKVSNSGPNLYKAV